MCNATAPSTQAEKTPRQAPPRLLLSLESYTSSSLDDDYDDDHNHSNSTTARKTPSKTRSSVTPPVSSCLATGALGLFVLVSLEQTLRYILRVYGPSWHELLRVPVHQQILARHLAVDTLSCAIVAYLGWMARATWWPVLQGNIPRAGWEERLFQFRPDGYRLSLFFFTYQIKNMADTLIWNDGPEFIFHHVFSLAVAWGAMFPGTGHMYAIFFFGLSEISTAVLCVLSNFDDDHGIPGLGDALPLTKVVCGAAFVVLFILCRCILWPWTSYYFCRDLYYALASEDPRAVYRRGWMRFFYVALAGMSILQVAWLGQILSIGRQELQKAGLID